MNRNWKQIATLIIALGVLTFSAPQATGEVVFSTFSPGDGFSAGAVGLNIFIDIAVSFVPQKDFTLDSVRVAVTHAFGPNDYVIRVTEDRCGSFLAPGGQPSATPLESLTGLFFPRGFPRDLHRQLSDQSRAGGRTHLLDLADLERNGPFRPQLAPERV